MSARSCSNTKPDVPADWQMTSQTRMRCKEVDNVFGSDEMVVSGTALKFVSGCTSLPSLASCDKCNSWRAFFYQLQI